MFSHENRESTGIAVWWFVLILILGLVGTFAYLFLLRPMLNLETQANRASYQYVDTKQTELHNLMRQYEDLDVQIAAADSEVEANKISMWQAQQKGIVKSMQDMAAKLEASQVPTDVRLFLSQHR
jgi:hypothetical protein